ncbi:DUF1819 family protein [Azospirillum brasilense]|uniref:DUF1819 family protein n=1 Tax=Azospirillum brasilense TaxID=192 RepID=A0A235HHH9_AZOBR|nr:DUF1819 family protein [Azospirillum brasilense]OYD85311.1 hypothetical protein CHT98_04480 [Azospirillum brasilense]
MDALYKADIAGGSLKVPESRVIAGLLLDGADDSEWRDAIEVQNVLQKRSPGTAKRQALLVRSRLATMGPELWELVRDGSNVVATHAVFACAIKHSRLLGDFLDLVVREQFRLFRPDLPRKRWNDFIDQCRNRDPFLPEWQESTSNKLADSIYRILAEVGYLTDTKNYRIQPVRISAEVLAYLREHEEQYVLRCIQVSL